MHGQAEGGARELRERRRAQLCTTGERNSGAAVEMWRRGTRGAVRRSWARSRRPAPSYVPPRQPTGGRRGENGATSPRHLLLHSLLTPAAGSFVPPNARRCEAWLGAEPPAGSVVCAAPTANRGSPGRERGHFPEAPPPPLSPHAGGRILRAAQQPSGCRRGEKKGDRRH
jgi:hypothetical protein